MTGGTGNDRFNILDGGDKTIFDFNTNLGDTDVIKLAFFDNLAQLKKSAHVVDIDGQTSTRIDYIAEGEQTSLTLIGYDIAADKDVSSHFLLA